MSTSTPVSTIMTLSPVVATTATKFSQVLRLFTEFPVHHLPIVDDNNDLIGIVSSNDLSKVFVNLFNRTEKITMEAGNVDREVNIADIMTRNPYTIRSSDSIHTAAKIFADKKFLSLPVVDNNKLVGILSAKDIIGYIALDEN